MMSPGARRIKMAHIKQNKDDCTTELWLNGEFHASWGEIEIPGKSKRTLEAMIEYAIEHGKRIKSAEIREVIGA
jgi:hypothetical protein